MVSGWRCLLPNQLSPGEWHAWEEIQGAESSLQSPYFHPEFTQAVAAERDDVYVTVGNFGAGPSVFFPFQRGDRFGIGRPVGGWLNDFHGVIASSTAQFDVRDMLKASGLSAWTFSHLPAGQANFLPHSYEAGKSPYVDLSHGFMEYLARLERRRFDNLRKLQRRFQKQVMTHDSCVFQFDNRDPDILAQLITWKSQQYRQAQLIDIFQYPWVTKLLQRLHQSSSSSLRGVLSTLRFNDQLVSAHFGLWSRGILHYWFPGYDPHFAALSPGNMLLLGHVEQADQLGIRRIELGKGETQFKKMLMSGTDRVLEGTLTANPAIHRWRQGIWHVKRWLQNRPVFAPLRFVKRHWLGWDGSDGIR